jgi:hypothetical protein
MGDLKVPGLSESEMVSLRAEAEKLGLSVENYIRLKLLSGTDRGATARSIRARQSHVARRDSADLIRADRDSR